MRYNYMLIKEEITNDVYKSVYLFTSLNNQGLPGLAIGMGIICEGKRYIIKSIDIVHTDLVDSYAKPKEVNIYLKEE